MEQKLKVKRIRTRGLFKYCFVGIFTIFYPFLQLLAMFSESDAVTYTFNGKPLYGWEAILSAPLLAFFFALVFSLFLWGMLGVGVRVWSKFKPITITYVPLDSNDQENL